MLEQKLKTIALSGYSYRSFFLYHTPVHRPKLLCLGRGHFTRSVSLRQHRAVPKFVRLMKLSQAESAGCQAKHPEQRVDGTPTVAAV
jgi:hypothetical protein